MDKDDHLCGDRYAILGVTWRCTLRPHTTGGHSAARGQVIWPQHENSGARWTLRHPGAWMWHRIETSNRTACGLDIINLVPSTIKGRTLARPPAEGMVCPHCLGMAPWVLAVTTPTTLPPAPAAA